MPGTIQVSVLDFKSLASSSRVSIKVSKGKIEYQTWDKGEFSFPVTTLRDNLIITIHDAEGIEISRTGVETRLVVEKGVWDDIFSFEGGGHVHMKLQFVLNEEERQRIRIMRESALKKKQEKLISSGHGSYMNASISNSEVSGSQESSLKVGLLLANEANQVSVSLNDLEDTKSDIDVEKKHGSSENASISSSEVSANEASQVSVSLNSLKDTKSDIDMKKKPDEHRNSGHGSPGNASVSNSEVSGSQESSLQSGLLANVANQVSVSFNDLEDTKSDIDMKKKPDEHCNNGHGSPGNASYSNSEVSGSQESSLQSGLLLANEAGRVYVPLNSLKDAKFDNGSLENASVSNSKASGSHEASQVSVPLNKDEKFDIDNEGTIYSIQKQKRTDSVPSKLERRDQDSVLSELERRDQDSKKTGPAGKARSKVKNMISAFEGSVYQDVRPPIKPPPKISQMRKTGSDSSLVNSYLKEVETAKIIPPKVTLGTITREPMLDKYSKGKQSRNMSSAKQHPRRKSITKEGREENFRKDPREVEGNSNGKLEPVAIWSDDRCSIGSSGVWIFPGEVKGSCITTGSKQIFDITGGLWDETNTNQVKLSACDPKNTEEVNDADAGTAIVSNEDGKTSSEKLRPMVETSMDPEESIGPFGQAIKVVIMVGFATLVLLTGKRTYRLKSTSSSTGIMGHVPVMQI